MNQKANIIQWAIALAIGLAIGLPAALTTTHHVSQRESVHVVAAIIAILVWTLIIRALFFVAEWVYRRTQSGHGTQPRGHPTG
jgi:small neutral amino acid transporter SnatA (MarC family)